MTIPQEGQETLLPCPFCGETPTTDKDQDESLWSHNIVWWSRVSCVNCDVEKTECDDPDLTKVIAAWNQRAPVVSSSATATPPDANAIDDLIEGFQHACETVSIAYERGSQGDRARAEKERAILRNEIRRRLLSRSVSAPSEGL